MEYTQFDQLPCQSKKSYVVTQEEMKQMIVNGLSVHRAISLIIANYKITTSNPSNRPRSSCRRCLRKRQTTFKVMFWCKQSSLATLTLINISLEGTALSHTFKK